MGTFAVKFVVSHPLQPERRIELEGLVDTGALFTQLPERILAGIGIAPSGYRSVHYVDGTGAVVPVAKADISIHGVETATMILCGGSRSLVLIGATTLETLGFGVDPIHKTLIPIDAPMAAAWPAGSAAPSAGSGVGGGRAEDVVHRQAQIRERGGRDVVTADSPELLLIAGG
jgi:aspartyl protease family protein